VRAVQEKSSYIILVVEGWFKSGQDDHDLTYARDLGGV